MHNCAFLGLTSALIKADGDTCPQRCLAREAVKCLSPRVLYSKC